MYATEGSGAGAQTSVQFWNRKFAVIANGKPSWDWELGWMSRPESQNKPWRSRCRLVPYFGIQIFCVGSYPVSCRIILIEIIRLINDLQPITVGGALCYTDKTNTIWTSVVRLFVTMLRATSRKWKFKLGLHREACGQQVIVHYQRQLVSLRTSSSKAPPIW